MAVEEIDLTASDDEEEEEVGSAAPQPPPQPVTPIKCKSEDPSDAPVGGGEDDGLTPATTGGKGLWSLWTRNFKSPLLMLLDLVDNAVDAAMPAKGDDHFTGRVHIYRDLYEVQSGQKYTTGLCLRNNSHQKIAPMKEVLQLFISAKANSGSESIGENGVGLKQSCAALGDNSFVLVKNGPDKLELGIIAKSLQQEDKMILPSFEFQGGEAHVGQQMLEMLTKPQYQEVANVVAEYGRVRSGGNASVARGVARLNKKFEALRLNWDADDYVFEVVIDKITHRGKPEAEGLEDKSAAVKDVIQELQHEIPRRYLNIPESFKFVVGKKALTFTYWPERLVEFTKVEIPVRSKIPWDDDFGEQTPDSYWLRIYLGFDRYRIKDSKTAVRKTRKSCSVYIYSRASGRMVHHEPDARSLLSLNAGGTEFCQALTIIVDDIEGYLPLDPTKQGIAFGNEAHGDIHKDNLYTVMGCVVKFFYTQHKNKYGGSKAVLSKKILEFSGDDVDIPELKTCRQSELTDYGVHFIMNKNHLIQVDRTCYKDEIVGSDTHFRLLPDAEAKPPKRKAATADGKKASASTSNAAPAKKKQRAPGAANSPAKKKQPAKASKPPPRARGSRASPRKSSKPVQYADEEDSDDDSGDAHHVEGLGELLHQVGGRLKSPMDAKPCEALGAGWTKRTVARKHPKGGTKNDIYYFSPEGKRFKSMAEARRHLVKMEMDNDEADEGPIDLCSSSDEDDEDDVNEGGPAEADSEGTSSSPNAVSESEQNDTAESEPASDALKAENAKLRSENDELKARNGSLETQLEELTAELEKSKAELEKSKHTLSVIRGTLGASDEGVGDNAGNDVEVKADPGVTVAEVLNAK